MITDKIITANVQTPGLWIEKVVLYRSTDPVDIIRTIPLTCGLNIVWGKSQTLEENGDKVYSLGHSVGKTTFCHLLCHLLGENIRIEQIDKIFPKGGVGAIIHLDNNVWSVFRPFKNKCNSIAFRDISLDELLDNFNRWPTESKDQSYQKFIKTLDDSFVSPLAVSKPPLENLNYKWEHLLPWLIRDQENRYLNLEVWRSNRSGKTGIPQFSNKKNASMFLIRLILDLVDQKEKQYIEKKDILRKQLEDNKKAQKEEEYRFQHERYYWLEEISRLTTIPVTDLDSENRPLLGLDYALKDYLNGSTESTNTIRRNIAEIRNKLKELYAEKYEINKLIDRYAAALKLILIKKTQKGAEEEKYEEMKFYHAQEKECSYGMISYQDCRPFNETLKKLSEEILSKGLDIENPANDSAIKEMTEEKLDLKERMDEIETEIQNREKQIDELEVELLSYSIKEKQIISCQERYIALAKAKNEDEVIKKLAGEKSTINTELNQNESDLVDICSKQPDKWKCIQALFCNLIHLLLGGRINGFIELSHKQEITFSFGNSAFRILGEAIRSFTYILADLTALFYSVEGKGFHPRFLVHDSPLEADLDPKIYQRFLNKIFILSKQLGGANAPFQYIVSTTTPPPDEIKEVVRLELQFTPKEELLFRSQLNNNLEEFENM